MPVNAGRLLRSLLRGLGHLGFALLVGLAAAWTALALHFQATGWPQILAYVLLAITALACLALRFRRRTVAWGLFALAALAVGLWYQTIQPRQDRAWAFDVAHGVTADVDGNIVTLYNLRDFDWTSDSTAREAWTTMTVDLDQLDSIDMFTSVWGNPDIAHLIVSFGFRDGRHVAFSVEIRKEEGEAYSTLGGFFRKFELALIAATERDVVRLRTNLRGEDVHLYPIALPAEKRRALFLSYLDLGNRLAERPKFYNTITANCTTTVFLLVRAFQPDLPLDRRLILSGRLPDYLADLGGLKGEKPMEERRAEAAITARAQAIAPGQEFSAFIRDGATR